MSGRKADTVFKKNNETVTLASYQVAWNLARAKKPYNDWEFVQKCLSDVVEILSPENKKLKQAVSVTVCLMWLFAVT